MIMILMMTVTNVISIGKCEKRISNAINIVDARIPANIMLLLLFVQIAYCEIKGMYKEVCLK